MYTTLAAASVPKIDYWVGISLTFPMTVVMPCGVVVTYNSLDDLPRETTHCPCGNPSHILVKVENVPPVVVNVMVDMVG